MRKIIRFLKEVREEFGHITWPKKDALIQLTFVVISISIIISLVLGGFDYLFTNSFALLTQLKKSGSPAKSAPIEASPSASFNFVVSPAASPTIKK